MGLHIKKLREAAGLSQSEMARLVGYADSTSYGNVERRGQVPAPERLEAIARELRTTPTELLSLDRKPTAVAPAQSHSTVRPIPRQLGLDDVEEFIERVIPRAPAEAKDFVRAAVATAKRFESERATAARATDEPSKKHKR